MQKILLLHGALGSAANFNPLKGLLSDRYEIHTLNFESHGGREIMPTLSISGFTEEVIAYLDKNEIGKISIFGYSMGGYVGLYMARNFPERIEKIFTLATKLNWTVEGSQKEAALLNPVTIKEKVPKYAAALESLHGQNWEDLLRKTAEMMLGLGKSPALQNEDFSQIETPVQMAVGDKDAMVSIEETVNAFRRLPNGCLLVLPNTPHPIDRVNTEELVHQIRNYFG